LTLERSSTSQQSSPLRGALGFRKSRIGFQRAALAGDLSCLSDKSPALFRHAVTYQLRRAIGNALRHLETTVTATNESTVGQQGDLVRLVHCGIGDTDLAGCTALAEGAAMLSSADCSALRSACPVRKPQKPDQQTEYS